MERDNEPQRELIDLGTASLETKGPHGPIADEKLGNYWAGLSDD
ncbi:benenodin family lasso peptide [Allosphingosinicella sp.]